tara:strand:- start:751 stop:1116 length:366 start_codon:yes stop_codon:yes gene_type:complete
MKIINLIPVLVLILFSSSSLNAAGLDDLFVSNNLAQLNLSATLGEDIDIEVWESNIKKLSDKEAQQLWYSLLLSQLNLIASQGGDLDIKAWERTIDNLTDKTTQQQWRGILDMQKLLKSLI